MYNAGTGPEFCGKLGEAERGKIGKDAVEGRHPQPMNIDVAEGREQCRWVEAEERK